MASAAPSGTGRNTAGDARRQRRRRQGATAFAPLPIFTPKRQLRRDMTLVQNYTSASSAVAKMPTPHINNMILHNKILCKKTILLARPHALHENISKKHEKQARSDQHSPSQPKSRIKVQSKVETVCCAPLGPVYKAFFAPVAQAHPLGAHIFSCNVRPMGVASILLIPVCNETEK